MAEKTLTLKEMCAMFDVTPRTLRYYEYLELISPAKTGRTRHYGATERARVKLIRQGRRFGFPLEELRQWLELYNQSNQNRSQLERWVEMSTDQIAQLDERRLELDEITVELKRLRQRALDSLNSTG
ncbi:MAG: MerR family DNA-binding transcriptional regulator [Paracoccaceae bacterium]|jgi:DNA-binding transcriptional MerR regulator